MTDILLLIAGVLALLVGLAGAFLPTPGPPLSLLGVYLLHYSKYAEFDKNTLTIFVALTVLISSFDYYAPIWGTQKFGGTSYGSWGSTIGLLAGLFLVPGIGMIFGAFLGAFVGELIGGTTPEKSLKAAIGSIIGLLTGILGKILVCLAMIVVSCIQVGEYFFVMFR
ncbi:MAG: DUF456 domain-containing protein [Pseudarcicella sp.]|nr:DUF456 domain-containing protein [Pseudarcicella sp.]MBP6409516.1 DUF456 domain-containing protein [Pseudarcicella sp.]